MPADIRLLQRQLLACRNANLPIHQVQARHPFRHGMLHLQSRIHLEKVEVARLIGEELHRPCVRVIHRPRYLQRRITYFVAQLRFGQYQWRWRLFHDFLVSPLYGTLTFAKVDQISVFVSQNLHFDMPRTFDELFQVNFARPKRPLRLARCAPNRRVQVRVHCRHAACLCHRHRLRLSTEPDNRFPPPSRALPRNRESLARCPAQRERQPELQDAWPPFSSPSVQLPANPGR